MKVIPFYTVENTTFISWNKDDRGLRIEYIKYDYRRTYVRKYWSQTDKDVILRAFISIEVRKSKIYIIADGVSDTKYDQNHNIYVYL